MLNKINLRKDLPFFLSCMWNVIEKDQVNRHDMLFGYIHQMKNWLILNKLLHIECLLLVESEYGFSFSFFVIKSGVGDWNWVNAPNPEEHRPHSRRDENPSPTKATKYSQTSIKRSLGEPPTDRLIKVDHLIEVF